MSDIIWHYCCLMGGVSASSAGGIRAGAAGAVCLHLNWQLLPPTLDSGVRGRTLRRAAPFYEEEEEDRGFLLLLPLRGLDEDKSEEEEEGRGEMGLGAEKEARCLTARPSVRRRG